MRGKIFSAAIILLVFGGSFLGKGRLNRPPSGKVRQAPDHCRRIVSMAPSITETLFALGLGDRVVGVTRYCSYPTEAKELPRIGGYLDPNFEAIVALKPDLVVMLIENEQSLPAFAKLGMTSLSVCHQNVDGILDSLLHIGQACDAEETARSLAADLQARMGRVRRKTAGLQRPRVLCAIERTLGSGTLEDVYVAGTNGFFDKIITLAGGRNAYRGQAAAFPVVSSEGILEMNPQVRFKEFRRMRFSVLQC